jgi:hypothetical protein
MTLVTIMLAAVFASLIGMRSALRFRDRRLAARGCPNCDGPLTVHGPVFGCRKCRTLWTASGFEMVMLRDVPVDLLPLPDEVPRAEARLRDRD